jgi:hypothetical protein
MSYGPTITIALMPLGVVGHYPTNKIPLFKDLSAYCRLHNVSKRVFPLLSRTSVPYKQSLMNLF